tara:strand:- start:357 stop:809 length:453 start_codon:yes stop_codon:yes gene_type:complete
MVLGDVFPAALKMQHAQDNLAPGSIIKLHSDIPTPAKEKFFIIAYEQEGMLAFIINTEASQFIQSRPHLLDAQVDILEAEHPTVLKYDSVIDCSKLVIIDTADAVQQVCTDMGRLHGPCSSNVKTAILDAVNRAPMYSDAEKKRLSDALS